MVAVGAPHPHDIEMRAALIAVILTSCTATSNQPSTVVPTWTTAPSPELALVWGSEITAAIDTWQGAIGQDCPFPLTIGADGNSASLLPEQQWPYGASTSGMHSHGQISVLGDAPWGHRAVLLHEMGHAIGLAHNEADATSIMWPVAGSPYKAPSGEDAANMRAAIGCDPIHG